MPVKMANKIIFAFRRAWEKAAISEQQQLAIEWDEFPKGFNRVLLKSIALGKKPKLLRPLYNENFLI